MRLGGVVATTKSNQADKKSEYLASAAAARWKGIIYPSCLDRSISGRSLLRDIFQILYLGVIIHPWHTIHMFFYWQAASDEQIFMEWKGVVEHTLLWGCIAYIHSLERYEGFNNIYYKGARAFLYQGVDLGHILFYNSTGECIDASVFLRSQSAYNT